jgi:hypothetical protein
MSELILHHYAMSPFSEKVRLIILHVHFPRFGFPIRKSTPA